MAAAIAPPATAAYPRPVQVLELAIDAMDIPAIQPFWRAVLGYGNEPGHDEPDAAIVDPAGQGPAIWFQQMDAPRAAAQPDPFRRHRRRTTRRSRGSGPRWRPAGRSSATRPRRRTGYSPTPRATRPASAPGCSGTSAAGNQAVLRERARSPTRDAGWPGEPASRREPGPRGEQVPRAGWRAGRSRSHRCPARSAPPSGRAR